MRLRSFLLLLLVFSVAVHAALPALLPVAAVAVEEGLVFTTSLFSGILVRQTAVSAARATLSLAANDALFASSATAFTAVGGSGATGGSGAASLASIVGLGVLASLPTDVNNPKKISVNGSSVTPKYEINLTKPDFSADAISSSGTDPLINPLASEPYWYYDSDALGSYYNPIPYTHPRVQWMPIVPDDTGTCKNGACFSYTPTQIRFPTVEAARQDFQNFCVSHGLPCAVTQLYVPSGCQFIWDDPSNPVGYEGDSCSVVRIVVSGVIYYYSVQSPKVAFQHPNYGVYNYNVYPDSQLKSPINKDGTKGFVSVPNGWKPDPGDEDWTTEEKLKFGATNNLKYIQDNGHVIYFLKTPTGIEIISTRDLTSSEIASHPDMTYVVRRTLLDNTGALVEVSESFVSATSPSAAVSISPNIEYYPNSVSDNSSQTTTDLPSTGTGGSTNPGTSTGDSSVLTDIKNWLKSTSPAPSDPSVTDTFREKFFNGTFTDLLAWRIPGSDACPTSVADFTFFGKHFNLNFNVQCSLAEEFRTIFSAIMVLLWTLSSMFIVLRA